MLNNFHFIASQHLKELAIVHIYMTRDNLDYSMGFEEKEVETWRVEDSSIYILFCANRERLVIMERGKFETLWGLLNVLSVTWTAVPMVGGIRKQLQAI